MSDPIYDSPSEQAGRDTFERYKEQAKAACLASLQILEVGEINRVFFEWHDDYVVRKTRGPINYYSFYQVKTNKVKSKQWSVNDLFGFHARTKKAEIPTNLKDSFIGKLLLHTIAFEDACEEIVFVTNKPIAKNANKLKAAIENDDIKNPNYKKIIENFTSAFELDEDENSLESIKLKLKKIKIEDEQVHLESKNDLFEVMAYSYIVKYSEIQLDYVEAIQIIKSILDVVEDKSGGKIAIEELTPTNIEAQASIALPDLLSKLSISESVYNELINSGDENALQTASTLCRILKKAGFKEHLIEQAAKYKSKWDNWYRNIRHTDFSCELDFLTEIILNEMKGLLNKKTFDFGEFQPLLASVKAKIAHLENVKAIESDILLGGFFSTLVKEY